MICKICQVKSNEEICKLCQKCIAIDLSKKCNHDFDYTCENCRKYNILRQSVRCFNCGNERGKFHSLCDKCVVETKICCEKRINYVFKFCEECSNKSTLCIYKTCLNEKKGESYCETHSCKNCNDFISYGEYCSKCYCSRSNCYKLKYKNSENCEEHSCKMCFQGIFNNFNYCKIHKCKYLNCEDKKVFNFNYCNKHKCKLCPNEISDFHNDICKDHKCKNCRLIKYKSTDYCIECVCKIKGCDDYKNNNHMTKCCPNNINLDYFKFHDYLKVRKKRLFYTNILKCFDTLLLCLKKNNIFVPKDIRKIIFYLYLENKTLNCFSIRCYICDNLYLIKDKDLFE